MGTEIFSGNHLRAVCYWPDRPALTARFDHWRMQRDGFPMDRPGGNFETSGTACLTIESAQNDWFLNPDLPDLCAALRRFTARYAHVNAIGFSMGGYGALRLAQALHLTQAILISPQISIRPEIAPYENRYLKEAAQIDATADVLPDHPLGGALLYDPTIPQDLAHKSAICQKFTGITPIPCWYGGHPASQSLVEGRQFGGLLQELFRHPMRPGAILRLQKRARENSPRYVKAMQDTLTRRSRQGR